MKRGRGLDWVSACVGALFALLLLTAYQQRKAGEQVVYITDTGVKYHHDGCKSLAYSRHPVQLTEAHHEGFSACRLCFPDGDPDGHEQQIEMAHAFRD